MVEEIKEAQRFKSTVFLTAMSGDLGNEVSSLQQKVALEVSRVRESVKNAREQNKIRQLKQAQKQLQEILGVLTSAMSEIVELNVTVNDSLIECVEQNAAPRAEPLTPITAPQKPPVQSSIVNQKEKVPIVVQNGSSKKPVASNAQQHVVKPQNSRVSPVQQEQQLPVVAQPVSAAQQQPVQPVIRQQQQPPVNSQQAKSPQQQGMNFQQGMNSQQPVNSQQPMNFEQPMNSQQPVVQPMNSQQFEQKAVPVPISTQLDDFLMPPSLDDLISSDAAPAVVQQQHGQTADPLAGLLGENDDQNSQLLSFHEDSKNLAKQTRIMQLFNNSSSQAPVAQQDKKTTPVADDFF